MKELKFKTSKGEFLVVDDVNGIGKFIPYDLVAKIGYIKNLTEEQAIEIVDKIMNEQHFQNYDFKSYNDRWLKTAIESLHSLLKSRGIHLFENPFYHGDLEDYAKYKETEQKTFYNPYIFKL